MHPRRARADELPIIEGMERLEGKPTAYVCEDYACQLPTSGLEKFARIAKIDRFITNQKEEELWKDQHNSQRKSSDPRGTGTKGGR